MQPTPITGRTAAKIDDLAMDIQIRATERGHRDIADLARRICQLNQPPPSDVVVFTRKFRAKAA